MSELTESREAGVDTELCEAAASASVPWRRLDTRMIWVDALKALLSLLPAGVAVLLVGVDSTTVWSTSIIAVVGVGSAIADVLKWIKTRYRVTAEHVELRSGLLVRSHRSVRRERIRTVDTKAKLRHRLAGLRIVSISAGQAAAAGESAFLLDAVSRDTALALQRQLLNVSSVPVSPRRESSAGDAEADQDAADSAFARFDWRWIPYNVFSIWAFVMAAGLLWGLYWLARTFGFDGLRYLREWAVEAGIGTAGMIAIGLAAGGVLGVIGLTANFIAENWNFRLERVSGEAGSTLRTTHGLFSTREVIRDDARLRGVQIDEPLLWRWIGAADTSLISTGLSQWGVAAAGAVVMPRARRSQARAVAAKVLSERPLEAKLRSHPRAAARRRLLRAVWFCAAVTAVVGYIGIFVPGMPSTLYWLGPALLPPALALASIGFRSLGHTLAGRYLVVRSGVMWRSTAALRRDAVIGWTFRQSVFQRRLGLTTVIAATAAGHREYSAVDMAAGDAVAFADAAVPGLLSPFLADQGRPHDGGADHE